MGIRERKKIETRRAIASAALRLAAERGPHAVTVEAITAAADVSPRTFFNYFATKEDAILGILPDPAAEVAELLAARPASEGAVEALLGTLTETSASLAKRADEWTARLALIRDHPSLLARYMAGFANLERAVTEGLARREGLDPDADLYPALVATSGLAALRVVVDRWHAGGRTESLDRLLADAFAHLARGMSAAPDPHLALT